MEISIKTLIIFGALLLTGLSAGFFYAWSVSVIPGTQKINDTNYLFTMQSINRAILNPAFFLIFFGSIVLLGLATATNFDTGSSVFWLFLASSVAYLFGTLGVTGLGNVPLNDELEALNLSELLPAGLTEFRKYFETKWNRLHQIRTFFAAAAFVLSILAAFKHFK